MNPCTGPALHSSHTSHPGPLPLATESEDTESWFAELGLPGATFRTALSRFPDPRASLSEDPYLTLLQLPGFKLKWVQG